MAYKAMLSKGDKILIADDQGLVEIEVLMTGARRCQLAVHAAKDRVITRVSSPKQQQQTQ